MLTLFFWTILYGNFIEIMFVKKFATYNLGFVCLCLSFFFRLCVLLNLEILLVYNAYRFFYKTYTWFNQYFTILV